MSVFETVIREVGGLLSAFELSGDRVFLSKCARRRSRPMQSDGRKLCWRLLWPALNGFLILIALACLGLLTLGWWHWLVPGRAQAWQGVLLPAKSH